MSDNKGRLNAFINKAIAPIEKNTDVFTFGTSFNTINKDFTVTSHKVKHVLIEDEGDKK